MDELSVALDAYIKDKDASSGIECIELLCKSRSIKRESMMKYRKMVSSLIKKKVSIEQNMDYLRRSYVYGGRVNFDDFMTAMEWKRDDSAKFWLPRKKVLEGRFHIASKIQTFIDSDESKLMTISCPPGVGKTTLIKFLLTYIAGSSPESANMYCSYSDGMVKMMYDSLSGFMMDSNEYCFGDIFPECGIPTLSAEYNTISFRKKGDFPTLGLVSLGGSVTGRTRANSFFVTDDLVKNDEQAKSPERLEKLYSDYTNTLSTRMIGEHCKQIMLGTIWSLYDPISRQRAEMEGVPGYEFIALPVCDEDGHSNFCYEHPDRYTDEMIVDLKRRLAPDVFSALYIQRGIEKEGMAFTENRLLFYNGDLPEGEPDNIMFYADVAWGGGDSFAMPIAYIYGDDVFIHDVLFDRGDKSITKPRVIGKILQHGIKMGRFEANNGGAEYADDVSKQLREVHAYSMNISARKAAGNTAKLTRIEQHQDSIRRFHYLISTKRSREYERFMNELMTFSFTQKNTHDDAPDSLAGLCEYLYSGMRAARVIERPF